MKIKVKNIALTALFAGSIMGANILNAEETSTSSYDPSYTLTKVESATSGDFVITKYELNDSNELVPVYYSLTFNSDLGDGNTEGTTAYYYTIDSDGNLSPATSDSYDIIIYLDAEKNVRMTDFSGYTSETDLNQSFKGLTWTTDGENGGTALSNYITSTDTSISIGDITGDFLANKATGNSNYGGVMYNHMGGDGTISIDSINGSFIDNYTYYIGGAIANRIMENGGTITIGTISGDFISNEVYRIGGGAIGNVAQSGTLSIGLIEGSFLYNYSDYRGGAIYNYTSSSDASINIDTISADFISNSADYQGGAIFNRAELGSINIGTIEGSFISNYTTSQYDYSGGGGAIANYLYSSVGASITIDSINANFTNNYVTATATSGSALGGAIFNYSLTSGNLTITSIEGDFSGNYVKSTTGSSALGGAIYNETSGTATIKIDDIDSDFTSNYAYSTTANALGGAIYNEADTSSSIEIGDIVGNFTNNYAKSTNSDAYGGAIFNYVKDSATSKIGNIKGDFIGNTAVAVDLLTTTTTDEGKTTTYYSNTYAFGGAIFNEANPNYTSATASIGDIVGNFTSNGVSAKGYYESITTDSQGSSITIYYSYAGGGAVYNYGTINSISGILSENYSIASGSSLGGAIYNPGTINSLSGEFNANYAYSTNSTAAGGAIINFGSLGTVSSDFTGNYAISDAAYYYGFAIGGAIYNVGTITSLSGDFTGNSAINDDYWAAGGAIYNYEVTLSSVTGDFDGNYASSANYYAEGGAIYNDYGSMTVEANFTNNYTESTNAYGGAVYVYAGTMIFTANTQDIYNIGNWAGVSEDTASDKNGGFLYMYASNTTFSIGSDYTMTIGDGTANQDSIAGTGTITKDGAGELIVNSSMEYYTGSLSVEEGTMTVNNILGATSISIDEGATLTIGISDYMSYMKGTETALLKNISSADSVSNSGTLNLVANASAVVGDYTVSASGVVTLSNVFGGTYDETTGIFSVAEASSLVLNTTGELTVSASERVAVATSETNDRTAVYLAFSSDATSKDSDNSSVITVTSISENETFVSEYVANLETADSILASAAYDFDINLESGSVMLSLYVGVEDYDVSQFTIYHSSNGTDWDTTSASNVTYDGTYVSFEVTGFSTFGYTVSEASTAVPEPSTYALIIGLFSLGFVAYRRRK